MAVRLHRPPDAHGAPGRREAVGKRGLDQVLAPAQDAAGVGAADVLAPEAGQVAHLCHPPEVLQRVHLGRAVDDHRDAVGVGDLYDLVERHVLALSRRVVVEAGVVPEGRPRLEDRRRPVAEGRLKLLAAAALRVPDLDEPRVGGPQAPVVGAQVLLLHQHLVLQPRCVR